MKILFLDESGDHNLLVLDKDYPIFVLGGCIMDEKEHDEKAKPALSSFKKKSFGTEKIILHFRDYARSVNGFEQMRIKEFRAGFYAGLEDVMRGIDFILLACVIDKSRHLEKYQLRAMDPYLLSLEILVERFAHYLKEAGDQGIIIAESRGSQLDNEINLAFLGLKINGTRFLKPKDIAQRIDNLVIHRKEENVVGLQITDSLVSPIGRRYLGYKDYLDYRIIEDKFRKNREGKYLGSGLVILPKKIGGPRIGSDRL